MNDLDRMYLGIDPAAPAKPSESEMEVAKLHAVASARRQRIASAAKSKLTEIIERRPNKASGWRHDKRRQFGFASQIEADAYSVWTRGGIFLISTTEIADYQDGSGEEGPTWHISLSGTEPGWKPVRCSDLEVKHALACFRFADALEEPSRALPRHFWMAVDPKRRSKTWHVPKSAQEIRELATDGRVFSAEDIAAMQRPNLSPIVETITGVDPEGGGSVTATKHEDGGLTIIGVDLATKPDVTGLLTVRHEAGEVTVSEYHAALDGVLLRAWDDSATPDQIREDLRAGFEREFNQQPMPAERGSVEAIPSEAFRAGFEVAEPLDPTAPDPEPRSWGSPRLLIDDPEKP